eukprot:3374035-Prymnesium_polylepis.2
MNKICRTKQQRGAVITVEQPLTAGEEKCGIEEHHANRPAPDQHPCDSLNASVLREVTALYLEIISQERALLLCAVLERHAIPHAKDESAD